jgi:superfamily II DNA helicase RecQ
VVVFCNAREQVEEIQKALNGNGVRCSYYHGKMDDKDKGLMFN